MAQETVVERAQRMAKEAEAVKAAQAAQAKADQAAAVDPKVAESRARQEREEAEADNVARQQAAVELAAQNAANAASVGLGAVSFVTPNAANLPVPAVVSQQAPLVGVASSLATDKSNPETGFVASGWRTFQHQYANANTILPNGKKLIFGGQNGHTGQYSTNVPAQIEHLEELSRTPGTMVTEVRKDPEGRYIVVTDAILQAEQQAALIDSRTNSAADLNPNVVAARSNLARQIAADS